MRSMARHIIAVTTVCLMAWFGLSLISVNTTVGIALLALAGIRLTLWITTLVRRARAQGSD
jgi:hypothetical protein